MKLVRFSIILIVGCLHFWGVGRRRRRRKTRCVLRDVNVYYSDCHLFFNDAINDNFFLEGAGEKLRYCLDGIYIMIPMEEEGYFNCTPFSLVSLTVVLLLSAKQS